MPPTTDPGPSGLVQIIATTILVSACNWLNSRVVANLEAKKLSMPQHLNLPTPISAGAYTSPISTRSKPRATESGIAMWILLFFVLFTTSQLDFLWLDVRKCRIVFREAESKLHQKAEKLNSTAMRLSIKTQECFD